MKRYNPKEIEPKWQAFWQANKTYEAADVSDKPKIYAAPMFPYPSGSAMHVGHVRNFALADIVARYKRQTGHNVMHVMAWDAFGLPAENFAIKTGTPPAESTKKNIVYFKEQLQALAMSYDWTREFTTSDPSYYRWTQWVFSLMYKRGLAYKAEKSQWWCDKCNTVLADEQVNASGKCWRHEGEDDALVTKKSVNQWFFKITDYADEILQTTDALNWPEKIKTMQKNWIGKKTGINITYKIDNSDKPSEVTVFTTRPDTNFGATFIVIAPEHPLAKAVGSGEIKSTDGESAQEAVQAYIDKSLSKSELDRQIEGKIKTGAFTGLYAVNQLNGKRLPIWVADFVLAGFGTAAVVGVPGHDIRDFEFAKAFSLPIVRVVVGEDGDTSDISEREQVQEEHGKMINSEFLNGMDIHKATTAIMDHMVNEGMGELKINYKIRDWLVSRQRYWGAPVPIVYCPDHGEVLVPEDHLPVLLPEVDNYVPDGKNSSVLAGVESWVNTTCPECGKPAKRETDTMDGYVCSTWYLHRYTDARNDAVAFDPAKANYWFPIDSYFGADHAVAHLLYLRFFQKVLCDAGLAKDREPVKQLVYNGYINAEDGRKMSKSLGNTVDPMDIINAGYGADALRIFEMFIAPYEQGTSWNANGVPGCHRFLSRLWTLVQEYLEAKTSESTGSGSKDVLKVAHGAIKKVTADLDGLSFNTAVAAMMGAVNELYIVKARDGYGSDSWRFALESMVQLIAPFAPHIAEELWHDLGHEDSVNVGHWPEYDEKYLVSDTLNIVVQVNGKVRANIEVASDMSKEDIIKSAQSDPNVHKYLRQGELIKTIFVPPKLVSLVVKK